MRNLLWLEQYNMERDEACKRKKETVQERLTRLLDQGSDEVRGVLQNGHLGNDLHDGVEM